MNELRRYRLKSDRFVVAVQLRLDTAGFNYNKWGSGQHCKAGDWVVENDGEIYTVDEEVFTRTYREVSRGVYVKDTPVWARRAESAGYIRTKEGQTHYEASDYLVYNDANETDGYAMPPETFDLKYELDE
ncbi:hypothetical protein BTHE68_56520 [Burkholderia sp. THE68]|uniref:hypothetical protein n=1 Tax=Burkholderia sp. THE68 TaxID=758782 RepID=UPI0013178566|nr:hypothetical protein [Burkholderia sp. THE68]BBU31918.1 hypothetical protein BTHE68_56520 [Burkholderia sp. THE68]